jgi:cytochrome c-type biogenesis protein CcmH/NrfG
MNPAAQLAFARAHALAPKNPGPRFFFGLSMAQSGRFDEAEQVWRLLLAGAPADASWRPLVQQQLGRLAEVRRLQRRQAARRQAAQDPNRP